jgi:hypothetical protein
LYIQLDLPGFAVPVPGVECNAFEPPGGQRNSECAGYVFDPPLQALGFMTFPMK